MAEFDPDAYLASKSPKEVPKQAPKQAPKQFDPDAYLEKKAPKPGIIDMIKSTTSDVLNYIPKKLDENIPFIHRLNQLSEELPEKSKEANLNIFKKINPNMGADDEAKLKKQVASDYALSESAGMSYLPMQQVKGPLVNALTTTAKNATLKPVGKKLFQSGVRDLNLAAEQAGKGKNAISDTLLDLGSKGGSREALLKESKGFINSLEDDIQGILTKASAESEKGGNISNMLSEARTKVKKVTDNPGLYTEQQVNAANNFNDELNRLQKIHGAEATSQQTLFPEAAQKGISPSNMKELNKNLYEAVKNSSWLENAPSNVKDGFMKALASGNKKEYMRVLTEWNPKEAARFEKLLGHQANLLTARKAMTNSAKVEGKKAAVTQVDAMALALEPSVYAAKNAARLANSSWLRTKLGSTLYKPANSTALENLLLRGETKREKEYNLKNFLDSLPKNRGQ